jgi:hypothetical protein
LLGRWSTTNYETSPLDSERTTAGVALGRRSSARSELSLNAVTESIDFDDELNTDFDRDSVFVGWQLEGSRTTLDANVGYTWLERDGSDKSGSALIDINVTRHLTAASTLRLSLGQQLGDTGDSLRSQLSGSVVGSAASQITATSDPFESQTVSLEWGYLRGRTSFSLGASHIEDDYETQSQLDRKRDVFSAGFSRRMASTLTFDVRATYTDEKFTNVVQLDVPRQNDEVRISAILNWRAWSRMGLRLLVERFDRGTDTGATEFEENRAFLTLTYDWGAQDISQLGGGFR